MQTAGEQVINVTVTTYFKNGKKAGLIHTQLKDSITITVIEKASVVWNGEYVFIAKENGNGNKNDSAAWYDGYAKIYYNGIAVWEKVATWSSNNVEDLATKDKEFDIDGIEDTKISVSITFDHDKVVDELPELN